MAFQIYNKELGFWVGESDIPTQDSDLGNTEVPLPGVVGQGITYAFDENIQMWRPYTAEQWQDYLAKKITRLPDDDEQFKAMVTGQLTGISKSVVGLSTQLVSTTQLVKELQAQVKQLTESKEEAQHV